MAWLKVRVQYLPADHMLCIQAPSHHQRQVHRFSCFGALFFALVICPTTNPVTMNDEMENSDVLTVFVCAYRFTLALDFFPILFLRRLHFYTNLHISVLLCVLREESTPKSWGVRQRERGECETDEKNERKKH